MKPVLLLLGLLAAGCASSGDAWEPLPTDEYMQATIEMATPGPEHEALAALAGTWRTEFETWWEPGSEPMQSTGTSTFHMILDGRYLVEDVISDFQGQPFHGMLILGYDRLHEQYVSIWMDTYSTWPSLSTGHRTEDGDEVMTGQVEDVQTPGGRPMRSVTHRIDDDHFELTMYDSLPDGSEFKVMHIRYTRL